ncbi:MAG: hypothetical protein DRH12_19220 [Deltaproteobacteria bacterium]|nr:MAG: hypothetical protein DRH12_19220 [Deltaproteobacteria bacterium]
MGQKTKRFKERHVSLDDKAEKRFSKAVEGTNTIKRKKRTSISSIEKKKRSLTNTLPIPPMTISGETRYIHPSEVVDRYTKVSMPKAVVAYLDVLGFSRKKCEWDTSSSLLDFSGPLLISAYHYPKIKFNVFSDCAFISSPLECAGDMISAIRFAFTQWAADGVFVRGGLAIGTYNEIDSSAFPDAPQNYVASLFYGTGVTTAVNLKGSGHGALLFLDDLCAKFYGETYGEPIFVLDDQKVIGWSDDLNALFWFAGISLLRLIRFLSIKGNDVNSPLARKLFNNLLYSLAAVSDRRYIWSLTLAILSLPDLASEARKKVIDLFHISDPEDFVSMEKLIQAWLSKEEEFAILRILADMDSSI